MTEVSQIAGAYLKHVIKGDKVECSSIAKNYLDQSHSFTELYEHILKKALYDVGFLWETNKISVATEHMATAITESILNELYVNYNFRVNGNKKAVLTCVENEQHQVGIKMVADTFESHGWETFFLGTGIPVHELIAFIHQTNPEVLAVSLSVYFNFLNLNKMLESITSEFPNLEIIIGGQAFNNITFEFENSYPATRIIRNLFELHQYIETKHE